MPRFTLHRGDCIEVMRSMPDNSVDSICTDPPYGLSFMSHKWDYDVPGVDVWKEALRVLKPGGHLLAFSGSRTYHRMVVAIEDAGFEVRDQIMWVYGSGMPKSLDVSKAIDKDAGFHRDSDYVPNLKNNAFGKGMGGGKHGAKSDPPITAAAAAWKGWGTALKPSHEPICVARKPFRGTVASNVLQHGTGALNIDACRVELDGATDQASFENNHRVTERLPADYEGRALGLLEGGWKQRVGTADIPTGRWPANLIHDGSDEVVSAFPGGAKPKPARPGKRGGRNAMHMSRASGDNTFQVADGYWPADNGGSAARFFYSPKATKKDRGENNSHPTVKPTEVCRWLLRLVTPPGGTTLDMYCGSGSFGKAAMLDGFNFVGIDLDEDEHGFPLGYIDIARSRIAAAQAEAFDREMAAEEL